MLGGIASLLIFNIFDLGMKNETNISTRANINNAIPSASTKFIN